MIKEIEHNFSASSNYLVRYVKRKSMSNDDNRIKLDNLNVGYKNKNQISKATKSKIVNACGWLYSLSQNKIYKSKDGSTNINYKCAMITLTLSDTQKHDDKIITSEMLSLFLQNMRDKYKFSNYVWRAEVQKNGNIHYHIITDSQVNYYVIRYVWNRIQNRFGYIDSYKEKYSNMSYDSYKKEYLKNYLKNSNKIKTDLKQLENVMYKGYLLGKKQNWEQPNSVDVKFIHNDKTFFQYIAKYISKDGKDEENETDCVNSVRSITGRIWSQSNSLSQIKNEINKNSQFLEVAYDFAKNFLNAREISYDYHSIVLVDFKRISGWLSKKFGNILNNVLRAINYNIGIDLQSTRIDFYQKHFGLFDFSTA